MRQLTAYAAIGLMMGSAAIAAGPANPDPQAAQAGSYKVEPMHTRVLFSVSHLGFTTWFGDFNGVEGSLEFDPAHLQSSKVDVTIPVASLSTTNTKLDGELKSPAWLGADQFPRISFVSSSVMRTGERAGTIAGTLTLHGVSQPVVLKATFNGAGMNPLTHSYTVGMDATTTIRRSDFGVKTYLPLVGDEIEIHISAAFEKKPG